MVRNGGRCDKIGWVHAMNVCYLGGAYLAEYSDGVITILVTLI